VPDIAVGRFVYDMAVASGKAHPVFHELSRY